MIGESKREEGFSKIPNKMAEEKDLERKILEKIPPYIFFKEYLEFDPTDQPTSQKTARCPFFHKKWQIRKGPPLILVDLTTGIWKCPHCGLGDMISFYMRRYHIPNRGSAIRRMAWEWGIDRKTNKGGV